MDFTPSQYSRLMQSIRDANYEFQAMEAFIRNPLPKVVVLRHDVDERPQNAVKIARVEFEMGIKSTYYFRILKISNTPEAIKKIVDLGHEIGYHYEDYAACRGNHKKAIESFRKNLDYFRQYYPVKTVCMHGSSMSDFDNRDLWKYYSVEDFGLVGDPYLSIDYSDVLYFTDTARRWDGDKFSVRDQVRNGIKCKKFRKTIEIINSLKANELPDKIVLQSHTLWTDSVLEWIWLEIRELTRNRIKLMVRNSPWIKHVVYNVIQKYSNR